MDAPPQRLGSRRPPYASTAAVLLGVVAVSQALPVAERAFGGDVPPLFAQLHPSIGPGLVAVAALAAAGWWGLPRLSRLRRAAFLVVLVLFAWTFAVALAASSAKGWSAVSAPFLRPIDYWANVLLVDAMGPRAFAEHYPHLAARLSLHATTHPPGAPLFLWALSKVAGGSVLVVAILVVLVGVAAALPVHALAREAYGERAARTAAVLFVCSPGVLLYSATSMDAVFMTVVALALAALVRAARSDGWALAAGLLTALALCFTFGALLLGPVALGLGLIAARQGRAGVLLRRAALVVAGLVIGALAARAALGIDLPAVFRASLRAHLHDPSRGRSYWYWLAADIPAFLLTAGIAQSALLVAATRDRWRERRFGLETVLWGTLALAAASGLFRGEVDHIWLFLVPLLAASAGSAAERGATTGDAAEPGGPTAGVRGLAAAGLGQAVAEQVLLYTFW